jgi:hypothetical protein
MMVASRCSCIVSVLRRAVAAGAEPARYVAERGGLLLGFIVVAEDEVEQVDVDRWARGTGIASALLERARRCSRPPDTLANVIARTTSVRADAVAAAHILLGVHKSLVAYTREQTFAGTDGATLRRRVAKRTRSGLGPAATGPRYLGTKGNHVR